MRYVVENGLGAYVTTASDLSSPRGSAYSGWKNSFLEEVLPVELNDKMK